MKLNLPNLEKLITSEDVQEGTLQKILQLNEEIRRIFASLKISTEANKSSAITASGAQDSMCASIEANFSLLDLDDDGISAKAGHNSNNISNLSLDYSTDSTVNVTVGPICLDGPIQLSSPLTAAVEDTQQEGICLEIVPPLVSFNGAGLVVKIYPNNLAVLLNQTSGVIKNVSIKDSFFKMKGSSLPARGCSLFKCPVPTGWTPEAELMKIKINYEDELGLNYSTELVIDHLDASS